MSLRQTICNWALRKLPPTRCYPLKARLLGWAGYAVDPSARITSSVKILGLSQLSIGADTFVGHEVLISGGDCAIVIGRSVDIAPRVTLVAGSHQVDMTGEHSAGEGFSRDIVIEDGAWIGAGAILLGGVTIGRKAVIAAGSVVTEDIPPMTMAAGVPCRPKKFWQPQTNSWVLAKAA